MAINAEVVKGKLIITADLDGNTSSKSGKSTIKASTGGFVKLGDISYSLNVISTKK